MTKSIIDFFKEVGLEEKSKEGMVSTVRLMLIGEDEDGYKHAEFTDFDVSSAYGRKSIKNLVDWLKRPNWKAYADKGMDYAPDEGLLYEWVMNEICFPTWEYGFCVLESWEITYYDGKGRPHILGFI